MLHRKQFHRPIYYNHHYYHFGAYFSHRKFRLFVNIIYHQFPFLGPLLLYPYRQYPIQEWLENHLEIHREMGLVKKLQQIFDYRLLMHQLLLLSIGIENILFHQFLNSIGLLRIDVCVLGVGHHLNGDDSLSFDFEIGDLLWFVQLCLV